MATKEQLPLDTPLREVMAWLRPRTEQPGGVQCPCCGQHAQAYKRTITGEMVAVMAGILDTARSKGASSAWVKLSEVMHKSHDTSMLAYWDLIREHGEKRGWWQITDEGEQFLQGVHTVQKYAHVYRNIVYAHTGKHIGVHDVEPKFDFDAVVRGLPKPEQDQMEV